MQVQGSMETSGRRLPAAAGLLLLAGVLAGCGPNADTLSSAALYQRGKTLQDQGQHQQAVDAFSRAVTADPGLAAAYFERGRSYAAMGLYETALTDYEAVLRLDTALAVNAYYYIGVAQYRRGNLEGAYDGYSQVIARRPEFAPAYLNRADVALALGRYEQTAADASRVLELDPLSPDGYALRGSAYEHLARPAEALADLKRALTLNPDHYALHVRLGVVYAQTNDFDQALEHLQTYLTRVPNATDRDRVTQMIQSIRIQQAVAPGDTPP